MRTKFIRMWRIRTVNKRDISKLRRCATFIYDSIYAMIIFFRQAKIRSRGNENQVINRRLPLNGWLTDCARCWDTLRWSESKRCWKRTLFSRNHKMDFMLTHSLKKENKEEAFLLWRMSMKNLQVSRACGARMNAIKLMCHICLEMLYTSTNCVRKENTGQKMVLVAFVFGGMPSKKVWNTYYEYD